MTRTCTLQCLSTSHEAALATASSHVDTCHVAARALTGRLSLLQEGISLPKVLENVFSVWRHKTLCFRVFFLLRCAADSHFATVSRLAFLPSWRPSQGAVCPKPFGSKAHVLRSLDGLLRPLQPLVPTPLSPLVVLSWRRPGLLGSCKGEGLDIVVHELKPF